MMNIYHYITRSFSLKRLLKFKKLINILIFLILI